MKKKFLSLIMSMFIIIACGCFSACNDKFKKLEFDISYAYSENATEWFDGNNGILINYGEDDNELKMQDGQANVFVKVKIKNVNEKHLDKVIITKTSDTQGVSFSSKTINNDEIFPITIKGNASTYLKFYETNSGKSSTKSLNVYKGLTSIDVDTTKNFAVKIGETIDLTNLGNLIFQPSGETNQIGVSYALDSIGGYQLVEGTPTFQKLPQATLSACASLENNNLTIKNYELYPGNYIIRIKATSSVKENISNVFDIFVTKDLLVETSSSQMTKYEPKIYFNDAEKTDAGNQIVLYNNNPDYSKVQIGMDYSELTSIYKDGVLDQFGNIIKFEPTILLDGNVVDVADDRKGLLIEKLTNSDYISTYNLTSTNKNTNKLTFNLGLNFSFAKSIVEAKKEITIIKKDLPTSLKINGTDYIDGNTANGVIYSTTNSTYRGLELTLSAIPSSVDNSFKTIEIEKNNNLSVLFANGDIIAEDDGYYQVQSGNTIIVNFTSGTTATLNLRLKNTPATFAGKNVEIADKYLNVSYSLQKKVTADSIEFFADKNCTTTIDKNNPLLINAQGVSYVYAKVGYSGAILDTSSINLISQNQNIKFTSLNSINFSDSSVIAEYSTESDRPIAIFKVPFAITNAEDSSVITAKVGDDFNNIRFDNANFTVKSVYITASEHINLTNPSSNSSYLTNLNSAYSAYGLTGYNFALKKGKTVDFQINADNEKAIKRLTISPEIIGEIGFSSNAVSRQIISNTKFNITGQNSSTTILNLNIEYYSKNENGVIVLNSGENARVLKLQVAVYTAISRIDYQLSNPNPVFINNFYNKVATSEISINAKGANGETVSSEIKIKNGESTETISSISELQYSLGSSFAQGYEIYHNNSNITETDTNISVSDKLTFKLTSKNTAKNINILLHAVNFGVVDNSTLVNINISVNSNYQSAKNIILDKVEEVNNTYNVDMSFMNVLSDYDKATATFYAQAEYDVASIYDDLGYYVEELTGYDAQDNAIYAPLSDSDKLSVDIVKKTGDDSTSNLKYQINLSSLKSKKGGIYRITIGSQDSYDDINSRFTQFKHINVKVSDGENYAYLIKNQTDLTNINNDLSANYVLAKDIVIDGDFTLIGLVNETVNPFMGTLSGSYNTTNDDNKKITTIYSITYCVKNTAKIASTNNVVAGLFAQIGETATVKDIKLNVEFDLASFESKTSGSSLNIGAVAGENYGKIDNVEIDIKNIKSSLNGTNISTIVNFGGYVGYNNGEITNVKLTTDNINLTSTAISQHNIGLVAGVNNSIISGNYQGKESLNDIEYSVFANLTVDIAGSNNIGGIAGNNSGLISNLLVGGEILDNSSSINAKYLGGLVGKNYNETGTGVGLDKGIKTCATLGLDLTGSKVGGAVGTGNLNIDDVRVMSVIVDNYQGQINASSVMAGLVAEADGGIIANSTVENFIQGNFNTLNSTTGATAYGLVGRTATGTATIENCFANININTTGNIYTTSNATETNAYFLGKVSSIANTFGNSNYGTSGYAVVSYGDELYKITSSLNDKITISETPVDNDDIYEEKSYLSDLTLIETEEDFNSAENVYELNGTTYTKLENRSEITFEENKYYSFNNTQFESDKEELFVKDENGILVSNNGEFNPNIKYYDIVYIGNLEDLYYKDNGKYVNSNSVIDTTKSYYTIEVPTNEFIYTTATEHNDNWDFAQDTNYIESNSYIESTNVKFSFPYLVKMVDEEKQPLMIVRPNEILASNNKNYSFNFGYIDQTTTGVLDTIVFNSENSDLVNDYKAVVLVNYFNNGNNTHKLVNSLEKSGLFDVSVLPQLAQKGARFKIVNGYSYASIDATNEYITFLAPSGNQPIVIEVYSMFNPEISDKVAIFTQYGITKLGLSSDKIFEFGGVDYEYEMSTYTGSQAQLINLFAQNKFNSNYSSIIDIANANDYLSYRVNQTAVLDISKTTNNGLTPFELKVKENATISGIEQEIVTFDLVLDLTKYFGDNYFPTIDGKNQQIVLKSVRLKVNVHQGATDVIIDGAESLSATSDTSIQFNVDLYTDYTSSTPSAYVNARPSGDLLLLEESDKDSLYFVFDVVSGSNQIEELKTKNNCGLYDLFDYDIHYEKTEFGYKYSFAMSLKQGFDYRYLTEEITLNVKVYAKSTNGEIYDDVMATFRPRPVSSTRIENYTATDLETFTDYTNLFVKNYVETSIISPGGLGGVMMLYVEPNFANIWDMTLTSEEIDVPSMSNPNEIIKTRVFFEQLVKIENNGTVKYETIYPANEKVENGIRLTKVSEIKNGKPEYNGIIYIHTQMIKFVGQSQDIDITLNVKTGDKNSPTSLQETKTLVTEYLPGAGLSFDGISVGTNQYLIEKGAPSKDVDVRVFGYQFNANPHYEFIWNLDNNTEYVYKIKNSNNNGVIEISTIQDINNHQTGYYLIEKTIGSTTKWVRLLDNSTLKVGDKIKEIDNPQNIYSLDDTSFNNPIKIANYINKFERDDVDSIIPNADGSYSLKVAINVAKNIPASFEMSATLTLVSNGDLIKSEQNKVLIFHPTDYIINSVQDLNTTNGVFNLNRNSVKGIDLQFKTNNPYVDYSNDIYEILLKCLSSNKTNIDELSTTTLKTLFKYFENLERKSFDDANENFEVRIDSTTHKIYLAGKNDFNTDVEFKIYYNYVLENGKYVLKFATESQNSGYPYTLKYNFNLNVFTSTTEEHALPIYNIEQLLGMREGLDYILMEDLVVENWTPITTNIKSFDGNNRKITIKSFNQDSSISNYGLFGEISGYTNADGEFSETILKNVVVDYSGFSLLNLANDPQASTTRATDLTFGGLVGFNNGGLIYNSDVVNFNTSRKEINILVENSEETKITFGGLVGKNTGIITNSRVGREEFTRISANKDITSDNTQYLGHLTFHIGDKNANESNSNSFVGIVGGFVGNNQGIISGSYIANASLVNYSANNSKTAGFAGENDGTITYSYVKADEQTISSTVPYATGEVVEAKNSGKVAGFVYTNNGEINNSFANTVLKSNSTYLAGFVYENLSQANIEACYSACTLNPINGTKVYDISEQPFVGISNDETLLSNGKISHSYYVDRDYIVVDTNNVDSQNYQKSQAVGLNLNNFKDSENLIGFMFLNSNVIKERQQGSWSYYTNKNIYHILPELTTANLVAHSYRYEVEKTTENTTIINNYENAKRYDLGSENNPYIIRDCNEFNSLFTANDRTSMSGYFRLIDNIDFAQENIAIKTRMGYQLGDNDIKNTVLEGNGMTISGISFNNTQSNDKSIGLFAKIKNSYIKNLNLEFVSGQFSTGTIAYSGGLAGIIENSTIVNVTLTGNNTTILGNNFTGGLAGMIKGNSVLFGIKSNLSVKTSNTKTNFNVYYNEDDYKKVLNANPNANDYENYLYNSSEDQSSASFGLSYAGGIAGVIDLSENKSVKENVSYLTVYGDKMQAMSEGSYNITADVAGGIAGYISKNTTVLKAKLYVGDNTKLYGKHAVGGLYGLSLGKTIASQVSYVEGEKTSQGKTGQYGIDSNYGEYVIDLKNNNEISLTEYEIGNTQLIKSENFAGGIAGVSLGASYNSCYSKATFADAKVVGGFVGASVNSSIVYSYAIPYVNLTNNLEKVGGLIGWTIGSGTSSDNNKVNEFISILNKLFLVTERSETLMTEISFDFSTLIVDNSDLNNYNGQAEFDYLCPDYKQIMNDGSEDDEYLESILSYVYVGKINYYTTNEENAYVSNSKIKYQKENDASKIDLWKLMDLSSYNVEQNVIFDEVFAGWSDEYWNFNNLKYFPLLIDEYSDNYWIIDEASDFSMLINNPDKSFKIIKDIESEDMQTWLKSNSSNFVFNTNFQGILIGEKEDGSTPVVKGLTVYAENPGDAGLFRQTTGATIRNVIFEWQAGTGGESSIKVNNNLSMVGGLTCLDTNSLFTDVEVRVTDQEDNDSYNNYLIKTPNNTIQGFGGLVATGTNTSIIGCNFYGSADVTLNADNNLVYFGGLIANATTETESSDDGVNRKTSISGSYVGVDKISDDTKRLTRFDINVQQVTMAYIGGAVGKASNSAISNVKVGNVGYSDNYKQIAIDLIINDNINFGGLAGFTEDCQVSNCDALTKVNISGNCQTQEATQKTINIGGLVGEFDVSLGDRNIKNSNTLADIKFKNAQFDTIMVSSGVANTSGNVEISQGLFTGTIDASNLELEQNEESSEQTQESSIGSIYAGSVVANAEGNITLTKVMSTSELKIGTSNTTKIVAGGLVGNGDGTVKIEASVSAGRIAPISSSENTEIIVGGLVGLANMVEANLSYSLATILSGNIGAKAIENINTINALFGKIENANPKVEKVYYNSDLSLMKEDSSLGSNLSTYTLLFTNIWQTAFTNEQIFTQVKDNNNKYYLPYITALENVLFQYKILNGQDTPSYKAGSVYKPQLISTNIEFNTDYTYYLISTTSGLGFTGTLNGILIGGETEYTISSIPSSGTEYRGLLNTVNNNSAISNLHIKLEEKTYEFNDYDIYSVIAGQNNGTIFNCSVAGKVVEFTGSSLTAIGLIAGENNGTVAYSYSSLEVKNCNVLFGGIVYKNSGKVLSNYFTGYVNNTTNGTITKEAYGIIGLNNSGYAYNNYMAGVITSIQEGNNSFAPNDSINNNVLDGSKNYIDSLANVETVSITSSNATTSTTIISTKSTYELMSNNNKLLDGNWNLTSTYSDNEFNLNMLSNTYGYNYNYPVYAFNKITSLDSQNNKIDHVLYQLYTGTGIDNLANDSTGIVVSNSGNSFLKSQNGTIAATTNDNQFNTNDVKNAFKIPHLGVLSSVQGLLKQKVDPSPITTNLNYIFIYDINGKNTNWTSVGTASEFKGNVTSFKYLNSNNPTFNIENAVTISNINGGGLFTNIISANFKYLKFSGTFNLKDSGVLGGTVGVDSTANASEINTNGTTVNAGENSIETSGNNSTASVFVDNIKFLTTTIKSTETSIIGGLFGIINQTNVSITNLDSKAENSNSSELTISGGSSAGLVAGELNQGTIEITLNNTTFVKFSKNQIAGGIVGTIQNGTITGAENTNVEEGSGEGSDVAKLFIQTTNETTTENESFGTLGGVAGDVNVGTISNINIEFLSAINADIFGGFVGIASGTTTIENCNITNDVEVQTNATEAYFGLLFGKVSSDVTIRNISAEDLEVNNANGNANLSDSESTMGVGLFAGLQSGNISSDDSLLQEEHTIIAKNVANLGGISGLYISGKLNIENLSNNIELIKLKGTRNVGGLFGYYNSVNSLNDLIGNSDSTTNGYYNFLDFRVLPGFAEIIVDSSCPSKVLENFGGLFGKFSGTDLTLNTTENTNTENQNNTIQNYNTIKIQNVQDYTDETSCYVKNVGGIVGYTVCNINNVANSGAIKVVGKDGQTDKDTFDEDSATYNKMNENLTLKSVNVGGIVGYANGSTNVLTINNVSINAEIQGYQNVGGIAGYLNKVSINVNEESESEENANVNITVKGVLNVGGVAGYANLSTFNNITVTGNIYGNTNVAGAVGYSQDCNLNNIIIGEKTDTGETLENQTSETTKTTIKAIYFIENLKSTSGDLTKVAIPSSIGGLVGYLKVSEDKGSITSCKVGSVKITSAVEGCITNENVSSTIKTTKNNMFEASMYNTDADDLQTLKYDLKDETREGIDFNAIEAGVGGFVGSLNKTAMLKIDTTNMVEDITIDATLGINVGTFYGYLETSSFTIGGEKKYLQTPTIKGTNSVSGAYNIGGLVGYIKNPDNATMQYKLNDLGVDTSDTTIKVQESGVGMYVGGLFGKSTSFDTLDATTTKDLTITIYTDNSYYIGGLIGRLEGNLSDGKIVEEPTSTETQPETQSETQPETQPETQSEAKNIVVEGDKASNFGGLVGMLKIKDNNTGGAIGTVKGYHKFPFTVNTIENSNYADGESLFNAVDGENGKELYAQAYYINQDSFDISGSADTGLYDGVDDTNPLNQYARGWHKDYTGFRIVQRNIPATENGTNQSGNNAPWDSIQIVYDAANITHVGTLGNLGLAEPRENNEFIIGDWKKTKDLFKKDNNEEFIYTDSTGTYKLKKEEITNTAYKIKYVYRIYVEDSGSYLYKDQEYPVAYSAENFDKIKEHGIFEKRDLISSSGISLATHITNQIDDKNLDDEDKNKIRIEMAAVIYDSSTKYTVTNENGVEYTNECPSPEICYISVTENNNTYVREIWAYKDNQFKFLAKGSSVNINDEKYTDVTVNPNTVIDQNHIVFTIYEEEPGFPKLYSSIGIATPAYAYKENSEDGKLYEDLTDNKGSMKDYAWGVVLEQAPDYYYYIDANNNDNLKDLSYFTWGEGGSWKEYKTIGNDSTSLQPTQDGTTLTDGQTIFKSIAYYVQDYLVGDPIYAGDASYMGKNTDLKNATQKTNDETNGAKGVTFVFQTVYENKSANNLPDYNNTTSNVDTDDQLPTSGSIFEVSGYISSTLLGLSGKHIDWLHLGMALANVAGIIGTGGISALLKRGGTKVAKKIVKKTIKSGIGKLARGVGKISIILMSVMAVSHTVTLFGALAEKSEQIYLGQTDQNFGYLSNSYTVELDKGKFKQTYDADIVDNLTGEHYVFYSECRPGDYRTKNLIGIPATITVDNTDPDYYNSYDNEDIEDIVIIKSTIDIDGAKPFNKNDITIFTSGNATLYDDGTENDDTFTNVTWGIDEDNKTYLINNKYKYQSGAYWINEHAGTITEIRTTLGFKEAEYETGFYDAENNPQKGIRLGDQYYLKEEEIFVYGEYDGANYYYNNNYPGNNLTYNDGVYTLNDVDVTDKAVRTEPRYFVENNETIQKFKLYGYDYIYTYFALNGDSSKGVKKYATFTYIGTDTPNDYSSNPVYYVTKEVKFITTDENGTSENITTGYFQIDLNSGLSDGPETTGDIINPTDSTTIKVAVYPVGSTNPYREAVDNFKVYYTYSSTEDVGKTITQEVKYFLFEGGYKTKTITTGENAKTTVYTPVNIITGLVLTGNNGDEIVSIEDLKTNFSNYENYYYQDEKISDIFAVFDGKLYKRNDEYFIKDGLLHSKILSFDTIGKSDYNYHKFITNENLKIYTRYKYLNKYNDNNKYEIKVSDLTGEIFINNNSANDKFEWITENGNISNAFSFTERCKVTLGGGKSLSFTDSIQGYNDTVKSGTITIT